MFNYRQLHYFQAVAKSGGIARAAEQLHLTPQTLSGQIGQLEDRLGVELFRRAGRRLELTDAGRLALSYADEIFQVGGELEEALRNWHAERPFLFRVGIADVVPKSIAYRLLAPALALPEQVRMVCREDKLERLLAELAVHRLDMVVADSPMPPGMDVKGYSHRLGECGMTFLAAPALAATLQGEFPQRLDRAPLLIPGEDSALRAPLLRWLHAREHPPAPGRRVRRRRADEGFRSGRCGRVRHAQRDRRRSGRAIRRGGGGRHRGGARALLPDHGGAAHQPPGGARRERGRAQRAIHRRGAGQRLACQAFSRSPSISGT